MIYGPGYNVGHVAGGLKVSLRFKYAPMQDTRTMSLSSNICDMICTMEKSKACHILSCQIIVLDYWSFEQFNYLGYQHQV